MDLNRLREKRQISNKDNCKMSPVKALANGPVQDMDESTQDLLNEQCSICLNSFYNSKSKSYASICFHPFCFECILEWSFVRNTCPLCQRIFDRIIYDVKSQLEFKEFFLKIKEKPLIQGPIELVEYPSNGTQQRLAQVQTQERVSRASWYVNRYHSPIEFRMMVYQNHWFANPDIIQLDYKVKNIEIEFSCIDLTNETTEQRKRRPFENDSSYLANSYKKPADFRNITPEFYQSTPDSLERIEIFIQRDLRALSKVISSSKIVNLNLTNRIRISKEILDLCKQIPINSDTFLNEIAKNIRPLKYARHFQHELVCFAKSISRNLIDYDAKCVYYAEISSMPTIEKSNNSSKIVPFSALPVNLTKYKLNNHDKKKDVECISLITADSENTNDSQDDSEVETINTQRMPPCILISSPSGSPVMDD